ncbi:winged helix-turn-helix domain-containing protein [Aeromonas jandaei]|nr:winged helix-turn-helix domain-containing protein [Aeromonas jandaei]
MLIDAQGDIVNRENLIAYGWPEKVVVPNALNMAVLNIRRALSQFGLDDAIVTIPRVGFKIDRDVNFFLYKDDAEHNFFNDDLASGLAIKDKENTSNENITSSNQSVFSTVKKSLSFDLLRSLLRPFCFFGECGYVFSFSIIVFSAFSYIAHESSRPSFNCVDMKDDNVTFCAGMDVSHINVIARSFVKKMVRSDHHQFIWVEINPHYDCGYKFFTI